MARPAPLPEHTPAHARGFANLDIETSLNIAPQQIRGRIPDSVRGTFFRIGPGRNQLGGEQFGHWFDGDGMMHAMTFSQNGAWYRNRYVRTPKYNRETAAGKIRCRSFGHNAPGGMLANAGRPPANAANTSLAWHGDRLLALWEGGRPWQLDPGDLSTLGECDFAGGLRPFEPFSAHGHHHPDNGCYYNHGISVGRRGPQINLYEIGANGRMKRRRRLPISRLAFLHGSALSRRYWLFLEQPLAMKGIGQMLLGRRTVDQCMRFDPRWGMRALVVDLETLTLAHTFELDPFVVFHFGNCRQEGNELVVELVRFDDFSVNTALRNIFTYHQDEAGEPCQLRLNLKTGGHVLQALPCLAGCEFPQYDLRYTGRSSRFLYSTALADHGGFFNAIQRQDTESGKVALHTLGPGRFASEAVFVPEGEREGDGYLCAAIYDANQHRSEVVLLDARSDQLEEVAAVPLPHHIPHGFHCGWVGRERLAF
ncbi:lignostilbene-alpha,beta-dioxygenase [Alcanivorax hongdengensis A-11-3]|uniref:Lignostilbene-alpha,beta-dioxygenase n=1 Tax=Alcanivorax hongdengensis A-11-3 TaxID=1177179 RepID=L0WH75_9GAMM|nr:carotenoid oxygenase family protein [Alcanivorax hongdengensis]EKF75472.1 lignostilbene-alpha,beta-dioxygenase [Alcanivorax hongdengensis A-11-3]